MAAEEQPKPGKISAEKHLNEFRRNPHYISYGDRLRLEKTFKERNPQNAKVFSESRNYGMGKLDTVVNKAPFVHMQDIDFAVDRDLNAAKYGGVG